MENNVNINLSDIGGVDTKTISALMSGGITILTSTRVPVAVLAAYPHSEPIARCTIDELQNLPSVLAERHSADGIETKVFVSLSDGRPRIVWLRGTKPVAVLMSFPHSEEQIQALITAYVALTEKERDDPN